LKVAAVSDGWDSSATYVLEGLKKYSKHDWTIYQYQPEIGDADVVYYHVGALLSELNPMMLRQFNGTTIKKAAGLRGEMNYKRWAEDYYPVTKLRSWVYELDAVACSNRYYYNEMKRFNLNAHLCPSGVDAESFTPQPYPDEFTVGFVGNPEHGAKNYALFKSLPFKQRYASSIPHNEMLDFYKSISVLVCCSWHEGSPVPPKEAAFCGKPTVAFNVGDLRDWLPENLIAKDREDVIMKLNMLKDNPELTKEYGLKCRERVESYNFINVAPLYDKMLESVSEATIRL